MTVNAIETNNHGNVSASLASPVVIPLAKEQVVALRWQVVALRWNV
jgi:hypothetical protein